VEVDHAACVDGLEMRVVFFPLGFKSEFHLHNGILLNNPDRHEQTGETGYAQLDLEKSGRVSNAPKPAAGKPPIPY
jgi:hypothetical protein